MTERGGDVIPFPSLDRDPEARARSTFARLWNDPELGPFAECVLAEFVAEAVEGMLALYPDLSAVDVAVRLRSHARTLADRLPAGPA